MRKMQTILMLGTSFDTMGGISSVVKVYKRAGLFDRWPIIYIATHCDGNKSRKAKIAISSFFYYLWVLSTKRIGVIHAHTSSDASFWRKSLFILIAYTFRYPVIFHLHGSDFMEFYEQDCGKMLKRYIRFILDRSTYVIVLSSQWKKKLSGFVCNKNIVCVYNPIECDQENVNTRDEREPMTLLFLGRFGERKGIFVLLHAIARLKTSIPGIRLLCGGDGDIEAVTECIKKLDIADNVTILGWIQGREKEDLLAHSTVYVLPSSAEGLPMGILEAMSAGLPVISTWVGGIPDAIEDGVEGYLVEPGNVDELSAAIKKILASRTLRKHMGDAARHKVKNTFCSNVTIPQLEVVYRELGLKPL